MPTNAEDFGSRLYRAYVDRGPLDPSTLPELTIEEGYAAQKEFVEHRVHDEGPVVGYKIGATSEAVRSELGISSPVYGHLLQDTVRWNRQFQMESLIEPMVEPEIAFVLEEDLSESATRLDVLAATRFIVPVIEVVDSRIEGWDVGAAAAIGDNSFAAGLVPGDRVSPAEVDLPLEGVEVLVNGDRRATGTGSAVLGHPAEAVAWLARALADEEDSLQAGDIVTTGSVTEPIPVHAGDTVVIRFSSLGSVVAYASPES